MNQNSKPHVRKHKKLTINVQTIRQLTADDLGNVAGARPDQYSNLAECTVRTMYRVR